MSKIKWENYGDADFIYEGGCFVTKENDNEFRIVKIAFMPEGYDGIEEDIFVVYDLLVDIDSNWIKRNEVMSFIGMTDEDFDEIYFAIGCTDWYSVLNFTNECSIEKYKTGSELIESLKYKEIEVQI